MLKRLAFCAAIFFMLPTSFAMGQQNADAGAGVRAYSEEKERRLLDCVKVEAATVSDYDGTPNSLYRAGEMMLVRITGTNTGGEILTYAIRDKHLHYSPQLLKDGEPLPYSEDAIERMASQAKAVYSRFEKVSWVKLIPSQPILFGTINLADWYGPLETGFYELNLGYSFWFGAEKIVVNTVSFKVVATSASRNQKRVSEECGAESAVKGMLYGPAGG